MTRLVLVVAAAFVDAQSRILIAQRPLNKQLGGLWEFPGGKVEVGERPEDALVREVREELDVAVDRDALEPLTFASHAYDDFHLLMPLFIVRRWQGEPRAVEAPALAWASPSDLRAYAMPPADEPLVDALVRALG
ncbi:MAG: (deoxy)nucleoside triphosphate pyrophosphohydrolase [Alphaproteobacteria bacterium]|nr:(deoxy)nucleoside triphosphate pyrophosphohydrolase [Alphaproteobacteria bacterium]